MSRLEQRDQLLYLKSNKQINTGSTVPVEGFDSIQRRLVIRKGGSDVGMKLVQGGSDGSVMVDARDGLRRCNEQRRWDGVVMG